MTHRNPDELAALPFGYGLDFASIDFREHPELYRVGKGEQGVLLVEPYTSELLPFWRSWTPESASGSADAFYAMFLGYKAAGDFVGMGMVRTFLQTGFTRYGRCAGHRGGRTWSTDRTEVLPPDVDPVRAETARIFYERYWQARDDEDYRRLKAEHPAGTSIEADGGAESADAQR